MNEPPPLPPRRRGAGAVALIAIGVLILVPSGLCSAVFGIGFLSDIINHTPHGGEDYSRGFIWLVPMFGGPPILIGAGLLYWGLRRRRG